jgi:hypothetical protein
MLMFSSKFPTSLRRTALLMHAKADHSCNLAKTELIARLAADSRLDTVWVELTKRVRQDHKPTPEYSHPACPPKHAAAMDPEHAQAKALEELFVSIVWLVESSRALTTQTGVRVADLLLEAADRLRANGSRQSNRDANWLAKAAQIYSSQQQSDPAREIAIGLTTYLKDRFGDKMYGTTASIVSVALETNITVAMVRNWCASTVIANSQNDQPGAYS